MMRVEYHSAAREEALDAYLYYAEEDENLARDFERKIQDAIQRISHDPLAYRVRKYDVRRVNLKRFKEHYVAYMIWREQIIVMAIGHAKRRPYYWYRRPKQYRETH
jgi:plasmid stabilization system protein ParE